MTHVSCEELVRVLAATRWAYLCLCSSHVYRMASTRRATTAAMAMAASSNARTKAKKKHCLKVKSLGKKQITVVTMLFSLPWKVAKGWCQSFRIRPADPQGQRCLASYLVGLQPEPCCMWVGLWPSTPTKFTHSPEFPCVLGARIHVDNSSYMDSSEMPSQTFRLGPRGGVFIEQGFQDFMFF